MSSVTAQNTSSRNLIGKLARLHDLWIVLAWGGILAGIFLNTFYNRNSYAFVAQGYTTATCQTLLDWALIFFAALGAGLTLWDERIAALGFLFAHMIATVLFVLVLLIPPLVGAADPILLDRFVTLALVLGLLSSFPIALFLSLAGSLLGLYLGGKISVVRSLPE